jgi:hypothetical protein
MNILKKKKIFFLNLLVSVFLLLVPYYLFSGKLYIGGDDTRLFYSYPLEFLKNITYSSWVNDSSIGINGPSQYMAPFLLAWSLLGSFMPKLSMNYFALSLPLILGFVFFQKTVKELFSLDKQNDLEVFIGSLFFILSPILIVNQYFVFLISIWLIGLIPIITYYFLRYIKSGNFIYVFISAIWCLVLGQAIYSIPWLLGFILPVILGLIITSFLFKKREIEVFIKKTIVFFGFIFASQAFWLTGFISTYLHLGQNSFASKFLSKGFIDTYTPTIIATATSKIIYPLMNLFHRQIAFDFNWRFKDVYTNFYDKTFIINALFLVALIIALLNYRNYLEKTQRKIFLFLLLSLSFSLYFFTVNVGPLTDFFIFLRHIPGFIMFRNFYDKFAPGYTLIYSSLLTISVVIFTRRFPKRRLLIIAAFLLVIIINFAPVKNIVNSPLWMTQNIHKAINIPNEYLNFMVQIKNNISSTNNILSIPFGTSVYSVIKEDNSNDIYAGVSPVKIFSGVNDISGHLSFNYTKEADLVDGLIVNRNYSEFNKVVYEHNINYVLVTKNVPKELSNTYLFNQNLYDAQDKQFIDSITSKKLFTSLNGNYELYKAKSLNSLINSKNVYFKKISWFKYNLYFKNLSKKQLLSFIDSFHPDWKLFIQRNPSILFCSKPIKNLETDSSECQAESKLFNLNDLSYSFTKPIFNNTHDLYLGYANKWKIDPDFIKNNFDKSFYKVNKDGSIDVEMILYFTPQNYFYLGILISIVVFISGGIYLMFNKKYEK